MFSSGSACRTFSRGWITVFLWTLDVWLVFLGFGLVFLAWILLVYLDRWILCYKYLTQNEEELINSYVIGAGTQKIHQMIRVILKMIRVVLI